MMKTMWAPWREEYIMRSAAEQKQRKQCGHCIFCEAPHAEYDQERWIIHRGISAFVILNLYPYNNGHLLIIPYDHVQSLQQLSPETHQEIMEMLVKAEQVLRMVYHPDGINLGANIGAAAGAGIDQHLHFHALPRWNADVNFMTTVAQTRVIPEALEMTWHKIKNAWEAL